MLHVLLSLRVAIFKLSQGKASAEVVLQQYTPRTAYVPGRKEVWACFGT